MRGFAASFVAVLAIAGVCCGAASAAPAPINLLGTLATPSQVLTQPDGRILVSANPLVSAPAVIRLDADGQLDKSFGQGGIAPTILTSSYAKLALQSDGRILVEGNGRVTRLNTDGSLDKSFGTRGITEHVFGFNLTVQPDDRFLLGGNDRVCTRAFCTGGKWTLARFDAYGTFDNGFGDQGKISMDPDHDPNIASSGFFAVNLDSAGNIYAGTGPIVKFKPDGTLDATFGTGGMLYPGSGAGATTISGDRFFVNSNVVLSPGGPQVRGVAKYDLDGTPDAGFGSGGVTATPVSGPDYSAPIIDPAGRIVLAGGAPRGCENTVPYCDIGLAVARLDADGSVDSDFGTAGVTTSDLGNGSVANATGTVDAQGRPVVAAVKEIDPNWSTSIIRVVRFNTDGTPDASFSGDGIADFPDGFPRCQGIADGRPFTHGGKALGTSDPDRMVGTDIADEFLARAGDDVLCGNGGADILSGMAGADTIFGGGGPDQVYGGNGNDLIEPGQGRDVVKGGPGKDRILARDGFKDRILCGPGKDTVKADRKDFVKGCEVVHRKR